MEREFRYLFNGTPQTSSPFQGRLTPQVSSGSSAQRSWSTRKGTPLTSCKGTPIATPRTTPSTRGSGSALGSCLAQPVIQGFDLRRPETPQCMRSSSTLLTPRPVQIEEEEKVSAWQNEVDNLEAQQVQIQADQMNLLHSQIHILTRELGDLQKQFVDFGQQINQKVDILRIDVEAAQEQLARDVAAAHEEAHAALRLELAEHGNSAAEMQAAWEEAHSTLSKGINDGLRGLAEDYDRALKEQSISHARALEEHASAHGNSLIEMEASHNAKHETHSANLQQGLEDVQGALQQDLAELRSGHSVNLQKVVEDVTNQVEILTLDIEQMAKDVAVTQNEAHSALRLELAEHSGNAAEMQAAWEEAHNSLTKALDDSLANLAAEHARALDEHTSVHAQALLETADKHSSSLAELEDLHNRRSEEHSAGLQKGLEEVHGSLQQDLAELRSGHAANLQKVVVDVTTQVDKLTLDMEQMTRDVAAAQEEAHSALRLELAEHGGNAADMKAAWEEAHNALSKAMDDNLGNLAADHARALEEHASTHAKALSDHADNHGSNLSDLEDLHNKRYEEHSASLQAGLEDVHGSLQKELAELRSGHEVNLKEIVTDLTSQVDKLTLDMEQLTKDIASAQEEAHSALRLELAEHGGNAADMKAAWEEAHKALSMAMDENLSDMAAQHAQALDSHKQEHSKALAEHADTMGNHGSNLSELEDLHNQRYEEHQAALQSGLEDVHGNLQKELAELRSGHAVNLQKIVEDVTTQVDKLTLDMEQMTRDVAAAQEEAHSALRLELAEHGGNAADMKAAWEEAHKALADSMDDNLGKLAQQHADAMAEHGETLGSVHGRLQDELKDLRSDHATSLREILQDVVAQVDTLTMLMENSSSVRTANTAKLETLFKGMSSAMNVSFRK